MQYGCKIGACAKPGACNKRKANTVSTPYISPNILALLAEQIGTPDFKWGKLDCRGIAFMLSMQANYAWADFHGQIPPEHYGDLHQPDQGPADWYIDAEAVSNIAHQWQLVEGRDPLDGDFTEYGFPIEATKSGDSVVHHDSGQYIVLCGSDGEMYSFYWLLRKVA